MALFSCTRLSSKSAITTLNRFPSLFSNVSFAQASSAMPKMIIKKYEEPKEEHFEIRNEKLKRPLSPHLTIYDFPLPAMMSISHRASGIILSGYFSVLGIGAIMLPHDISHYIAIIEGMNLSPALIFIAKACLAAPLGYHFANGVRHLYWDTAKGLTMKEIYTTGYTIMGLTALITLGLAAL